MRFVGLSESTAFDQLNFFVVIQTECGEPNVPPARRKSLTHRHNLTTHKTWNLNNTTAKSSYLAQIESFLLCSKLNFSVLLNKNPSRESKHYTNNCGFSICDPVLRCQWPQHIFGVDVAGKSPFSKVAEYKSRGCQDPPEHNTNFHCWIQVYV